MTHLGVAASALVDDQLDDETKRRMIAHLAGCAGCRAEIETERAVKARVTVALRTPALPENLLVSLARIAEAESRGVVIEHRRALPVFALAGVASRGRYFAAAGLAASVVVGLGAASLASGAGTAARAPSGPRPSTATIETALTSTPAPASSAPTMPFDSRPMLRQQGNLALSAVFRRP